MYARIEPMTDEFLKDFYKDFSKEDLINILIESLRDNSKREVWRAPLPIKNPIVDTGKMFLVDWKNQPTYGITTTYPKF